MENTATPASIPRPLVRANQWVIVLSTVLGWVTGWGWLLLIPLLSGLGGLLFNFNPVMKIARLFLRKPANEYIPEDAAQQRFNQMIATICLAGGLAGDLLHWTAAYYVFTIAVALAAGIAICGFCIGCFIHYQWHQYRYRRQMAKTEQ